MKYLYLKFKDASLKYADVKKNEEGKFGDCSLKDIENADWSSPIGVDQISNMLHVMFGLPPKASKRNTVFERNDIIYEMARNSYIKYDNYEPKDMVKRWCESLEFFQTAKPNFNAHSMVSTVIDGQDVSGYYSWRYFERRFNGKEELLNKIMNLFNDTIGVDNVKKHYYFPDFIKEFHKHVCDEHVKTFFEEELKQGGDFFGRGKPLNTPIVNLIENKYDKTNGSNTQYNGPTPLLLSKGTGRKISFSGEIIVPIDNDELVEYLEKWGTLPTLLDGGLVSVVGLTNFAPYPTFKDDFIHFSDLERDTNEHISTI